jgi:hypothetical protein
MNDSKFAVQLLSQIGAPLMEAVNEASAGNEGAQEQAAQIMAQLLGQAVQMGTQLSNAIGIEEDTVQADTTRVAVTSLCAPLIAKFYTQNKKVPAEDDTKRMVQSLEGILSFGENFSPASSAQSRLQTLGHDVVLFDNSQPALVMLQAMVPVINAVEEFPFGQAPRKLVQEITGKLEARAQDIAQQQGNADKLHELMIFKSLAGLYAQCHLDEIKRVSENSAESRDNLSLDPVWEHFETKVSMVETIMGLEGSSQDAQSVASPVPEEQVQPQAPVESAPTPTSSTPPPMATQEAPPAAASGGPMGFFKKPKEGDAVPAETSSAAPQEAETTAVPPTQQTVSADESATDTPPSNPMGFFKPGAKKADDSNVET